MVPSSRTAPESCEVTGVIAPEIQYRINLPVNWNRRLYIHGNGGYGGHSVYGNYGLDDRRRALSNGFVTAFSNLGHDKDAEPGGAWAHNASIRRSTTASARCTSLPSSASGWRRCTTAGLSGIHTMTAVPLRRPGNQGGAALSGGLRRYPGRLPGI